TRWRKPTDYGSDLISNNTRTSLKALKGIVSCGSHPITTWDKKRQKGSNEAARPRFVAALLGLLFDENKVIVKETIDSIMRLGLIEKVPDLLYTICYSIYVNRHDSLQDYSLGIIESTTTPNNLDERKNLIDRLVQHEIVDTENAIVQRIKRYIQAGGEIPVDDFDDEAQRFRKGARVETPPGC